MTDTATIAPPPAPSRSLVLRGPQKFYDLLFSGSTIFFAGVVLILLGAIVVSLITGSSLAFKTFGLGFIWGEKWNPVDDIFGARTAIYGTLVTSVIAMVIGVPLSFGISIFLTEVCPPVIKRPLAITIELLAGIPSIVYGIWGLFTLGPLIQLYVEPALIATFGHLPVLGFLFSGPPLNLGILPAGVILAIMITPFISSIMREVFETVPPMLKESAYGIGCTTWEVVWNIVLPFTKVGVIGGVMLGLGRAMGETMAVTFIIGNSHRLPHSLLAPGQTIASALANEFAEATDDLYTSSLIALGLILFVITFIILSIAKILLIQAQRKAGN